MKHLSQKQIALSSFPYYKYSLEYTLDSLQRLGAGALELYACDPHFYVMDCGIAEVRALKRQFKNHGIQPICLTSENVKYPQNIASLNPRCHSRSMETYSRLIQYASELECPTVQIFAGWGTLDESQEDVWSRAVDSVGYLAKIAEGYGVTIVLEPAEQIINVLTSSSKVRKMVDTINSPNVQGMIDSLCLEVCGETPQDAVRILGGQHIKHVHFSDGRKELGSGTHLIPGTGNLDLKNLLDTLDEIEYDGYFSMELMSPYEKDPESAMKQAVEWMKAHIPESIR